MADRTSIQLSEETRDRLREYQLPGESADDAVARMMDETEPPQLGVDAAEAERIAEKVVRRELDGREGFGGGVR